MATRNVFVPGKGSVIQEFTTAIADGVIYPADWVSLSTTAPGSQGSSGVVLGQTLGATDYLECTLLVTTALGSGSTCLGVVMGTSINAVGDWENVLPAVLADGDICVIQSKGVHPQGRQAASGVLGDYLSASTTAGEPTNAVSGTGNDAGAERPVGVCMIATSTYQRATAADEDGSVVWIDC